MVVIMKNYHRKKTCTGYVSYYVFSCRLYGLRKYKKQIEGDEEIAKELQNGSKSDSRAKNQN